MSRPAREQAGVLSRTCQPRLGPARPGEGSAMREQRRCASSNKPRTRGLATGIPTSVSFVVDLRAGNPGRAPSMAACRAASTGSWPAKGIVVSNSWNMIMAKE
jgi:hypothetical protein